jgi:hypothetical protein
VEARRFNTAAVSLSLPRYLCPLRGKWLPVFRCVSAALGGGVVSRGVAGQRWSEGGVPMRGSPLVAL